MSMKRLAGLIFLIDSIAIGLGGFGHGLAIRHVHAAIDRFPIENDIHSMIYVVWYFVSGCKRNPTPEDSWVSQGPSSATTRGDVNPDAKRRDL